MARAGRNGEILKEGGWDYEPTALEKDMRVLPKTLFMHPFNRPEILMHITQRSATQGNR